MTIQVTCWTIPTPVARAAGPGNPEPLPVERPDSRQVRVQRLYPKTVLKPAMRTMLVPVPKTATRSGQPPRDTIGRQPLRDTELLAWCGEVIRSVLADLAVGVLFT
jgi:hypothetical protein